MSSFLERTAKILKKSIFQKLFTLGCRFGFFSPGEELVLEEYQVDSPDSDAAVRDVENRSEEQQTVSSDERDPLGPYCVDKREIQHIHNPSEHERGIIEYHSIEQAVDDVSESSCTNKGQAHEYSGRSFSFADQGRNPPAKGTEQGDPEKGQAELADSTAELHSESHTLILDEEYLEPVPYYVEVLPDLHIGFDQDLDDLVDDHQQDSEDQEFLSFSETH